MEADPDVKIIPVKKGRLGVSRTSNTGGKMQRPLVICGPVCSGKSLLIDYLKYNKPDLFEHVLCHTSRSDVRKEETIGTDLHI